MSAPDGIESIIRRIVREEIDRAAAAQPPRPAADDRKLLCTVADIAALTACPRSTCATTSGADS